MELGVVGLGRMGRNIARRLARAGHHVVVYNRTTERALELADSEPNVEAARTLSELAERLEPPRIAWVMVPAGEPTELMIEDLLSVFSPGDMIVDGGNSNYQDTIRRAARVEQAGLEFVDVGTSGGIWGLENGFSLMVGGSVGAVDKLQPVFQSLAPAPDRGWGHVGPSGAGHFVKMVHNGIEYGDMQLISEAYYILSNALGLDAKALHEVFAQWNSGDLDSFLIDITTKIFNKIDADTGKPLVEMILDKAGQKGTGKWTSQSALDLGVAAPTIAEAVFARCISAIKDERVAASKILSGPPDKYTGNREQFIDAIRDALYASKICSYAQGFQLMRAAAAEYKWDLNYGEIAMIWRGGCIIRAHFLNRIKQAFDRDPKLANLLLDPYFKEIIDRSQANWRKVVATAAELGIPVPAFSSALAYYDSYRRGRLPANLIQAQRDFFGAHTYERVDKPGVFHTEWAE
jgi:6-phosphogluconate dehydrogenase